jgi:hypothetical protein
MWICRNQQQEHSRMRTRQAVAKARGPISGELHELIPKVSSNQILHHIKASFKNMS